MSVVVANSSGGPGLPMAAEMAAGNAPALDIIERAVRAVEWDADTHSVGRGSWPNLLGELELDASIMDGATLQAGAVGALRGFLYPISVARAVMERLPHVFLVGEGAARFADECGAERGELHTDASREAYAKWLEVNVEAAVRPNWPVRELSKYALKTLDPEKTTGTTCFLVQDARNDICAGVSTSGWSWKYPGRLGDSPVISAGCYADNEYGAAACIGAGEKAIRAGTARSVTLYLKMGMGVRDACREAVGDLRRLKGGVPGHVVIHALAADGTHCVVDAGGEQPSPYYVLENGDTEFSRRESEVMPLG